MVTLRRPFPLAFSWVLSYFSRFDLFEARCYFVLPRTFTPSAPSSPGNRWPRTDRHRTPRPPPVVRQGRPSTRSAFLVLCSAQPVHLNSYELTMVEPVSDYTRRKHRHSRVTSGGLHLILSFFVRAVPEGMATKRRLAPFFECNMIQQRSMGCFMGVGDEHGSASTVLFWGLGGEHSSPTSASK